MATSRIGPSSRDSGHPFSVLALSCSLFPKCHVGCQFKRLDDHSSLSNRLNWSKLKRLNDNSSLSNRPNWSKFKRLNDHSSLSNRPSDPFARANRHFDMLAEISGNLPRARENNLPCSRQWKSYSWRGRISLADISSITRGPASTTRDLTLLSTANENTSSVRMQRVRVSMRVDAHNYSSVLI